MAKNPNYSAAGPPAAGELFSSLLDFWVLGFWVLGFWAFGLLDFWTFGLLEFLVLGFSASGRHKISLAAAGLQELIAGVFGR